MYYFQQAAEGPQCPPVFNPEHVHVERQQYGLCATQLGTKYSWCQTLPGGQVEVFGHMEHRQRRDSVERLTQGRALARYKDELRGQLTMPDGTPVVVDRLQVEARHKAWRIRRRCGPLISNVIWVDKRNRRAVPLTAGLYYPLWSGLPINRCTYFVVGVVNKPLRLHLKRRLRMLEERGRAAMFLSRELPEEFAQTHPTSAKDAAELVLDEDAVITTAGLKNLFYCRCHDEESRYMNDVFLNAAVEWRKTDYLIYTGD